jgi:hypothetical protein
MLELKRLLLRATRAALSFILELEKLLQQLLILCPRCCRLQNTEGRVRVLIAEVKNYCCCYSCSAIAVTENRKLLQLNAFAKLRLTFNIKSGDCS